MALHVTTKRVTRKLKDGSTKQHKYYQLVRTYRKEGKVKTEFVAYLGKSPCIDQRRAVRAGISPDELHKVKGLKISTSEGIDWEEVARRVTAVGMPMHPKNLKLIRTGRKRTTLRSLKYDYPFVRTLVKVPDELTPEIADGEGYDSVEGLLEELNRLGHKLPKKMWVYDLTRPVSSDYGEGR